MTRQYELDTFWEPIVQSYLAEKSAHPPFMGLEEEHYQTLYDALKLIGSWSSEQHYSENRETYKVLLELRKEEREQLESLLLQNADTQTTYSREAACVMACCSLGLSHLWSDLGLPERSTLSDMIRFYFPELHAKNTNNMRWKRFFYRQLCETGGDYVCRSPSCEECNSYQECFAPEL